MKFFGVFVLCILAVSADHLTSEEASYVKSSWTQVKKNEVDILYYVFKSYPDIQAKFPQFAGKDLDEIKGTAEFATHATRIISFLSEVVSLSGDEANYAAIEGLAKQLASTHKPRGVTPAQFTEFRTAFFSYLKANVDGFDGPTEAAWFKAFEITFKLLFSALNDF